MAKCKRRLAVLLVGLMILGSVFAEGKKDKSASAGVAVPATGDVELVVMNNSGQTTLDPCHSGSMTEDNIFRHVFDTLTMETNDFQIIPGLATSWDLSEDKKTWTFHLRDDVKFHDGVPFTADDVVYTFERAFDPATQLSGNFAYVLPGLKITDYVALDDYTVAITTENPIPSFAEKMAEIYIMPRHHYEGKSAEFATQNPLGSGSFKFVEWVVDDKVVLERNSDYWMDIPTNITKLTFKTVPEASTRIAEVMTAANATVIDKINLEYKPQLEGNDCKFVSLASGTRQFIGFTLYKDSIVTDKLVRQAINYSVDFDAIRDSLLGGIGERTGVMVAAPYSNPNVGVYEYNPEKAKALLAEAGYRDTNGDGVLEDRNGKALSLVLNSPNGRYIKDAQFSQAVADYITQIGIPTKVNVLEWSVYAGEVVRFNVSGDMFFLGSGSGFSPQADLTDFYSKSSGDYTQWKDAYYDSNYEKLLTLFDEEEVQKISYDLQAYAFEEAPVIFLYYPPLYYGTTSNLDWTPKANGRMYFMDAIVYNK